MIVRRDIKLSHRAAEIYRLSRRVRELQTSLQRQSSYCKVKTVPSGFQILSVFTKTEYKILSGKKNFGWKSHL